MNTPQDLMTVMDRHEQTRMDDVEADAINLSNLYTPRAVSFLERSSGMIPAAILSGKIV